MVRDGAGGVGVVLSVVLALFATTVCQLPHIRLAADVAVEIMWPMRRKMTGTVRLLEEESLRLARNPIVVSPSVIGSLLQGTSGTVINSSRSSAPLSSCTGAASSAVAASALWLAAECADCG